MIRQAIIPLAGLGTRLLPLTSVFAKELLPMHGKPGIEYILDECIDAGIKHVIFIISEDWSVKKPKSSHLFAPFASLPMNRVSTINITDIPKNINELLL